MIRISIVLFLIAVLVVGALALLNDPGTASLVWLDYRISMPAAAAILLVLAVALAAAIFWRVVLWVAGAPKRTVLARAEQRRAQSNDALSKGFLAAAAGDGSEARRLAQKAADLGGENPALVRILAAQAAETAGDLTAAKAAYKAMLAHPEMRLAALRGLMQNALAQNDRAGALGYAQEAYSLARTSRWAWRALLEDRLENGDWAAALDLVKTALDRKIVSPIVADRARAALLAASAAGLEDKRPQQALDFALQSVKLAPGFAPGAVMAARLLSAEGKQTRAAAALEAAWKAQPHPALWLAYRDLVTTENPRERARRLSGLAALNPDARESKILAVEQALISGAFPDAKEASRALADEPLTARLCGLYARLSYSLGDSDGARVWMAKGAISPAEPDWSDLDPEGHAFNYTPGDWARLVSSYAETGELIHPRYERREATMSDLPKMPVAYEPQAPFVSAAETGFAPMADDPGFFAGAFDDAADHEPPPRETGGRRRGQFPLANRRRQ